MKKLFVLTLISATTLGFATIPASAAEVDKDTSDLGIQFDTDGPVKPGPGPYKDNLALVWTPSKFDFGKQKAVGNSSTYNNTVQGDQFIVVNDDRAGETNDQGVTTTSSWKVTATLSKLLSTDSSTTELPAKLTFGLDSPQAYNIGEVDAETNDFTPNPIEGNLSTLIDPNNIVVGKNVVLEAGNTSAVEMLGKTKADTMKDGFATKLTDTKLVVTSSTGAEGKKFKGAVTWSLDNTY
ncbi:WxL domain-containing protein [Enterococcus ureasiticus]|uniref:WxL domain-containing protein n=1 Tax=Enterococcus ureasiticus TaxID=903984 RepID=A0A1E5GAB8_9ENTE|nr:WxL domain-containing protein [Enterococcus ureasiticus]OEG09654.1 hypothetical protein BCR21_15035 [Enterococcus ureasiticus]